MSSQDDTIQLIDLKLWDVISSPDFVCTEKDNARNVLQQRNYRFLHNETIDASRIEAHFLVIQLDIDKPYNAQIVTHFRLLRLDAGDTVNFNNEIIDVFVERFTPSQFSRHYNYAEKQRGDAS